MGQGADFVDRPVSANVLADTADIAHRLWGFAVPVVQRVCRQPYLSTLDPFEDNLPRMGWICAPPCLNRTAARWLNQFEHKHRILQMVFAAAARALG